MLQGQIASISETGGSINPDQTATIRFYADGTGRGVAFADLKKGQRVEFQRDVDDNGKERASHVRPLDP